MESYTIQTHVASQGNQFAAAISKDGTTTPTDNEPTLTLSFDCLCGFLHGPGQGHHEDLKACGLLSNPLFQAPP